MDQTNDRKPTDQPTPAEPPAPPSAPRKRFRIEKVEERIVPGGHYNSQSKWVGGGGNGGSIVYASSLDGVSVF